MDSARGRVSYLCLRWHNQTDFPLTIISTCRRKNVAHAVNTVSFFQQHREVVHRNAERETKWAPMQMTIASLAPLRRVLAAATQRYHKSLSHVEATVPSVEE